MATRKELTGKRDLDMSSWIRGKLPDSSAGFLVSDIDFFIFNYKTKNIMIIEVKTRGSKIKTWQKNMYANLHRWLNRGVTDGWIYHGIHLITFENKFFYDGKCYLDNKEISELELINFLSFN